ncbi:MAG: dTDP-4-amino-4,6-dideoxygalactose transaminase [Saprospiraceae bacterium]
MNVPFNKPYLSGQEFAYMATAAKNGKLSGNGEFTKKCHAFFEQRYGFRKCLLTTSGTDALEMAAILLNLQPGDEVIMPSYTFVSTANAFVMQGAKIVFCDSMPGHPNIDAGQIEALITPRTRAIVVVHYAGASCDMDVVMALAQAYGLLVVEDAAQAIDGFYKNQPLGGIGHLAAFSFHETKNIICGEGGMLVVNDERFVKRSEIIWEKGTNRSAFFRGEVAKYDWVDIGSSFLPSELNAAFLYAQLECLEDIQQKRKSIWNCYYEGLKGLADEGLFQLPDALPYSSENAHCFYLVCQSQAERNALISHLKALGIHTVFHYLSLHKSPFYLQRHDGRLLPHSDRFTDCLLRFPLFYELELTEVAAIVGAVCSFFENKRLKAKRLVAVF